MACCVANYRRLLAGETFGDILCNNMYATLAGVILCVFGSLKEHLVVRLTDLLF